MLHVAAAALVALATSVDAKGKGKSKAATSSNSTECYDDQFVHPSSFGYSRVLIPHRGNQVKCPISTTTWIIIGVVIGQSHNNLGGRNLTWLPDLQVLLFFSLLDSPYAAHSARRRARKPVRRSSMERKRRVHTKWYLPQTWKPLSPSIITGRVRTTPPRNMPDGRRTRIIRMRPLTTLLILHSTTTDRILRASLRPSTTPLLSHQPNRRTTPISTTTTRMSLFNLDRMLLRPRRTITEEWTRPNTTRASRVKHLLLPWTITSCAV
jgi:hypothetical protein